MLEKYNIDIIFDKSNFKKDEIDNNLINEIKRKSARSEIIDIKILEKNNEEKSAIKKLNKIAGNLFNEAGFEKLFLDEKYIHIVSSETFKNISKSATSEAFFKDGHIYISRTGNINDFIHSLSHEMMHDFSYLANKASKNDDKNILINTKRKGYGLFTANNETLGVGMTEGMCELMAINIRERYLEW